MINNKAVALKEDNLLKKLIFNILLQRLFYAQEEYYGYKFQS